MLVVVVAAARVCVCVCYPFKVVHVSGLHWSPYKGQVVHLRRFLIVLVRLDEELKAQTLRVNKSIKTSITFTTRVFTYLHI